MSNFNNGYPEGDLCAAGGPPEECNHGLIFDEERAMNMSSMEIRKIFPRLFGKCPKGCGFEGIGYVSMAHYTYGDW